MPATSDGSNGEEDITFSHYHCQLLVDFMHLVRLIRILLDWDSNLTTVVVHIV